MNQRKHPPMTEKQDIYSKVTNKIITDLEKGDLTWMKPWETSPTGRPLRSNGMPYHGVNVLILWMEAAEKGYTTPIWMTYNQAQELGGQVRKGQKGSQVVYGNVYTKTETDETGEETERTIPFLKTYTVFNVEQIDGLPAHYYAKPEYTRNDKTRIEEAERFFEATGATIRHGGNKAYYSPALDAVQMPLFEAFYDSESYYGTLAHEVTHWTKHPSRLNREFEGGKRFGEEGYAMEELVAELGAAFVCADLGIMPEPREDTAAYIQSWLKVLKDDKRAIFTAASHAQKAADFMHHYHDKADERIEEEHERGTLHDKSQSTHRAA